MNLLTAEQQIAHARATTCVQCNEQFTKKNKKTKHHCHLSGKYLGLYCNTCNLKVKYKRGPHAEPETDKKSSKRKATKYFNGTFHKFLKKTEDATHNDADLDALDYVMTDESYMIPVFFHNLKGYDAHIILQYFTQEYAPNSINVIPTLVPDYDPKSQILSSRITMPSICMVGQCQND